MAGARIQLKRATASQWTSANTVLFAGEIGYETDTNKFKIGDGTTAWTSISYFNGNLSGSNLNDLLDVTITSAANGDFLRWNGTAWINDAVNLGTDTAGSFVESLIAGTGVTLTNNSGESSTPTIAIGQSVATNTTPTFAGLNLNGNITFEGATADDFETVLAITDPTADRTITIPNATGTVALNGSIALGTDTTGNYVNDVTAGTGVTVTHTPGEGSSAAIAIGQSVATTDSPTFANLTITAVPTSDNHAATKAYVDFHAAGIVWHDAVRLATTAVLPGTPTYNNGTSGVGATLTAASNARLVVDGTNATTNDRVLVKDQADATQNGVYKVTAQGSASVPYVLTRATDFDASPGFEHIGSSGDAVYVTSGAYNPNQGFITLSTGTGTDGIYVIGTDNITFGQFTGTATFIAGNGVTITGNTINVESANAGRIVVGGDSIDLALVTRSDTSGSAGKSFIQSFTTDSYGRVTGSVTADAALTLGTDTTGSYVTSLVAGTGITLSNNSGEGATPTVAVTADTYDAYGASSTVAGNLTTHANLTEAHGATGAVVGTTNTQTLTNKTLTSPKVNEDVVLTSTATELNILDGATLSTTELNYVDGVTSAIQTQLDAKAPLASPTFTGSVTLPDNTVALGTKTTGDYVATITGGTGVSSTAATTGEGTTHTLSIGQAIATTDSPTFAGLTVNGASVVFEGATANDFETTLTVTDPTADRTITLPDATGTVALSGSIALGTDTTGNYMSGVSVQNGLTVSHTPGEGSTATIGADNALLTNYLLDGAAGNSYGLIGTSQYLDIKNTNGYNKEIELDIAAVKTQLNTDGYLTESSTSTLTNKTLTSPKINENVALTATATELNVLDGITSSTAELNILDGVTSSAAELNILDGATLSTTELNYVDGVTSAIQTQIDAKAPTASPTFTGTVTLAADPSSALQAATKQYVDNVVSGVNFHASVVAATSGNLAGTYANGTSGVGATITKATNGAIGTIDGATVVVGSRILLKSQTDAKENGIYTVTAVGSVSAPWVVTRATDADNNPSGELANGDFCFVTGGSTNGGYGYINSSTANPIVIGTDDVTYAVFNAAQVVTGGAGLAFDGNILNVGTASTDRIVVNADNIDLASGIATIGTYKSVTVDTYGRVTAGTNPTTLSGYGITDAAPINNASFTGTFSAPTGTITSGMIADATIVNDDISGTAAISVTKIASGTSGQMLITGAAGAIWVSPYGDVTMDSTGQFAIAANSVALGTDTTGPYVSHLTAGTGVTLTNGTMQETGTPTISIGQAVATSSDVSFNTITTTGSNGLVVNYASGDEGGEILLAKPATNTSIAGTGVTIDVWQNRLRIFEQGGDARGVFIDLTAATAGVATNLLGDIVTNARTASYTLVLADKGKLVEMSVASGNTLTVPPNSSVAFPVGSQIRVLQTNTGQCTLTAGAGVTINGTPGLKLRTQWASATLIKRATDTWVAVGDLSA